MDIKEICMREYMAKWFQEHEKELAETADAIFRHPEVSLQERESSRYLADFLEKKGFRITWGLAGFETAFLAEWGSGTPVLDSSRNMTHCLDWDRRLPVNTVLQAGQGMDAGTIFWEQPVPGQHAR